MYNIALAIAIAISATTMLGSEILVAIMPIEVIMMLPHHLQLGLMTTFITSLIIYLILRAIRAERFLKASKAIHALLAIANIQRLLYMGLLMLASTMQGGGLSFVLMTLGSMMNPFFNIVLACGLLWLLFDSLMADSTVKPQ